MVVVVVVVSGLSDNKTTHSLGNIYLIYAYEDFVPIIIAVSVHKINMSKIFLHAKRLHFHTSSRNFYIYFGHLQINSD